MRTRRPRSLAIASASWRDGCWPSPGILGVATALRPPGEEPWVFVDIEGRDVPTEVLNGRLPGFLARFNQVDTAFFDIYQVPAPCRSPIQ